MLLSASTPLSAVGLVGVAVAATWAVLASGLGPPGAMFFVMVYGTAVHLTAPRALGGGAVDSLTLVGAVAVGVGVSLLVVSAPLVLPRMRSATGKPRPRWAVDLGATDVGRIVRTLLVATAGAAIGMMLGTSHAYWIVASSVAISMAGDGRRLSVTRALHRVVGTIGGVAVFLAVLPLSLEGVLLGVLLAALQFVVELLVMRHYALALVGITPLVLLISTAVPGLDPVSLGFERLLDTAIGAALAVIVVLVVPPRPGR